MRLNLTLDDEHAALLSDLAEAAHMQAGTLARSMLLTALDDAVGARAVDAGGVDVIELLSRIPGAAARHRQGLDDLAAERVVSLDEF